MTQANAPATAHPPVAATAVPASNSPIPAATNAPVSSPPAPAATDAPASNSPIPTATAALFSSSPIPAATNAPLGPRANDQGSSTVEMAYARLQQEAMKTTLVIVSSASTGVEGDIYRDMRARIFRASTGPDEGIDTHSLSCYPNCVFVPVEEVNALTVDVWVLVLRHEYRHMVQASHNPNMSADYRGPDGRFTVYAAFSEACADFGLNVAPVYQAQVRMEQLRGVLGADQQPLIDQACQGDRPSYDKVVQMYNSAKSSDQAFALLYPTYS
jgi:hypothetical protein